MAKVGFCHILNQKQARLTKHVIMIVNIMIVNNDGQDALLDFYGVMIMFIWVTKVTMSRNDARWL